MVPKHVVKPGETLLQIARMHGLTVNELRKINVAQDLDPLMPGTAVYLPMPYGDHHIREEGVTLRVIASKYGLTTEQLLVYNPWFGPDEEGSPDPAYHLWIPKFQFAVYTVKPGDTLQGIASKYAMPVQELVALNARPLLLDDRMLTWYGIYPGQKLAVPVTREDYMPRTNEFGQPYGMYYPMVMFPVRVMRNR